MPASPAVPQKSATTDQRYAASTPTETSVSIVVVPWRRLVHAARWNGQPPQSTTGPANAKESHCQWSNCHGGTIARTITGTESTIEAARRCCRDVSSASGVEVVSAIRSGGAGSSAAYPAAATVAISRSVPSSTG